MGSEDMRRQRPNVERMGLLGAEVRPVEFGTRTLKEATSEAIRDWITNVETTHYLIGSCVGPASVPGDRPRAAGRDRARGARAVPRRRGPPARGVVACVGGGSNAIGIFAGFLDDAGRAADRRRGARRGALGTGRPGVLHGARSSLLADEDGQIARRALDLGRARLPRRRARARVPARQRPRRVRERDRRGGAGRVPAARARRRESSPRSSRRTRSRARPSWTPSSSSSVSPAAATRTWTRCSRPLKHARDLPDGRAGDARARRSRGRGRGRPDRDRLSRSPIRSPTGR